MRHERWVRSGSVAIVAGALFLGLAAARAPAQVWAYSRYGGTGDRFGFAVANVGDLTGDGIADLLVGEPGDEGGDGHAYLYDGRTLALVRDHDGGSVGEQLGYAVAGMGDLNADGYADYAIGAPFRDGAPFFLWDSGAIVVHDGFSGGLLWSVVGTAGYDYVGSSFTSIGDLDGDGRSELLVGVPQVDEARIYDSSGLLYLTLSGFAGSKFGEAVARIGDVDGDGKDDFAVASPYWDPYGAGAYKGRVNVYSGAAAATYLGFFVGENDGDLIGFNGSTGTTLAGIGDVDGDGVKDILAGAPYSDATAKNAGLIQVVSGATLDTIRVAHGGAANDRMGYSVVSVGDFNHDGVDDYAAGAPNAVTSSGEGLVRVFSGLDGSVLWDFTDDGDGDPVSTPVDFGFAVAGGDFNADGSGDVVIGDPEWFISSYSQGLGVGYLGCPAWWESYGAGWPGKNGVPALVALVDPVVGAAIDVQLDNSLGSSTLAILLLGFAEASVPTNKDGTILVDAAFTVPISLPPGGLTLSGSLPDDPALYFFELFLQAIEADPFASKKISFTPGLKLHCGIEP